MYDCLEDIAKGQHFHLTLVRQWTKKKLEVLGFSKMYEHNKDASAVFANHYHHQSKPLEEKKENKGILLKCFELMVWTIYQNVWFNSKWRCLRSPHYHLELRSNSKQNPKTMISFPPIEGTDLSPDCFIFFFVQGQRSKRVSNSIASILI